MQVEHENGKQVTDPVVLGYSRCLVLLTACARYIKDLDPYALTQNMAMVESLTNLFAGNVIDITRADGEQLSADILNLAKKLEIEVMAVVRSRGGFDA